MGEVNVNSEPNSPSDIPSPPADSADAVSPQSTEGRTVPQEATERVELQENAMAPIESPPEEPDEDQASAAVEEAPTAEVAEASEVEVSESPEEEPGEIVPVEVAEETEDEDLRRSWYILKVQVNREESIRDALKRRVKIEGLERFFGDIVVPTEDIAEFTKTGKRRIVKRKLYPGYIMVSMAINDDTWFLVRETPGIGDFTGSAGKPTPMEPQEVERILNLGGADDSSDTQVKTAIPFKMGDRVRVKEGYFQNFEGDVESVDEANGRVTVMINIFGRSTPVELEHWQVEAV